MSFQKMSDVKMRKQLNNIFSETYKVICYSFSTSKQNILTLCVMLMPIPMMGDCNSALYHLLACVTAHYKILYILSQQANKVCLSFHVTLERKYFEMTE